MDKILKNINGLKIVYLLYFVALVGLVIYLSYQLSNTFETLKKIRSSNVYVFDISDEFDVLEKYKIAGEF